MLNKILIVNLLLLTIPFYIRRGALGYAFSDFYNTSEGYCDVPNYGRVTVGESFTDDENCEAVSCEENGYTVVGCGLINYNSEHCRLVPGTGEYPFCCEKIECDQWVEDTKKWICELC